MNHPIVKYDDYLLRKAIGISFKSIYDKFFKVDKSNPKYQTFDELLYKVFSSKSLSKDPNHIEAPNHSGDLSFSLLSDIDILFYMKNNIENEDVAEFFKRDERKSAIWKSPEEYSFYLPKQGDAKKVTDFLAYFNKLDEIENLYHPKRINEALYNEQKANTSNEFHKQLMKNLDILKNFHAENNYDPFDLVILPVKNSFSTKIRGEQPFIKFKQDGYVPYNKLQNEKHVSYDELQNEKHSNKEFMFFYVYSKAKIDAKTFLNYILENLPCRI